MSQTNIERKNHEALSSPVGSYSHAVRNGNTFYLSGFTAFGTEAQGKTLAEQEHRLSRGEMIFLFCSLEEVAGAGHAAP